jgi:DNA-binding NarL/FixJ family response regulator
MKQTILVFSVLVVSLLILFKISKYAIFIGQTRIEILIAVIALVFLIIGILLNKKSLQKKVKVISRIRQTRKTKTDLTIREFEVLELIVEGLSNKEIAAQLFVTESTIKTHVSNILIKLDAKRRTEAIQKAKQLQIIDF